jgi:hypothetical protein
MDVPNLHVRSNSPPRERKRRDLPASLLAPLTRPTLVSRRAPQVIKLMQSFKSKEYVKEAFAWRHYYWYAHAFTSPEPVASR